MSNQLSTSQIVANELLLALRNTIVSADTFDSQYQPTFKNGSFRTGASISYPAPTRYTTAQGPSLSAQDVLETTATLTLDQNPVTGFSFTPTELAVSVVGERLNPAFQRRYIKPAAAALANAFDKYCLTTAYQGFVNVAGTPGTIPNTMLTYGNARARLVQMGVAQDDERYLLLDPNAMTTITNANNGLFNPSQSISGQYKTGKTKYSQDFYWNESANVRTHTVGALGGTPVIAGASQTGTNINTSGWPNSTLVLKKGDKVTFAGSFAVNPLNYDAYSFLQPWSVTADVTSDGAGLATIPIIGPQRQGITVTTSLKNASASPTNGGDVVCLTGTGGQTPIMNLAYHRQALQYAVVPLPTNDGFGAMSARAVDDQSGLSVLVNAQYAIGTGVTTFRAEMLFGATVGRPEWGYCVIS